MVTPRHGTLALYIVLLVLVVTTIVILVRLSLIHQKEIIADLPPPEAIPADDDVTSISGGEASDSAHFAFTRFTRAPLCFHNCDVEAALPSGLECHGVVGLHVRTNGTVTMAEMLESAGGLCDGVILEWAKTTRWTSAYDVREPVDVWIIRPVDVPPSDDSKVWSDLPPRPVVPD